MNLSDAERTHKALRESESRYRVLVESAPSGIFVDVNGRFAYVNSAMCRILGADSPSQLIDTPVFDRFAPELHAVIRERIGRISAGEPVPLMEGRYIRLDGSLVEVETVATPITFYGQPAAQVMVNDITERKRANAALRRSEADLHLALDAARMGQWHWNILTGDVTWSPRCLALYGLPSDAKMSYEAFLAVLHPDDRARVDAALRRAVENRTGYEEEKRVVWADGSIRWTASRGQVYCDDTGRPVRMAGVTFDITDRKRIEAELQEQHAELQLILDTVPALIFFKDRQHRLLRVNAELGRLVGRPKEEFEGRTPEELGSPYAAKYRQDEEEVIATGQPKRGILEPLATANGTRWLLTDKIPRRNAEGNIVGIIGFAVDITERKRIEEALAESENRLRAILESEPECVKLVAQDGTLIEMNPAGLAMIEAESAAQVVGQNVSSLVLPKHREAFMQLTAKVFTGDSGILEFEIIGFKGTRRWLEMHATPLRDKEGRITAALSVTRDVTERRRAEEELRRTNERFQVVARATNDAVWDWDLETNAVRWNDGYTALFGYPAADIQPGIESWHDYVHPDEEQRVMAGVRRVMEDGGELWSDEYRFRRSDGTYAEIFDRGFVLRDPEGKPVRMIGAMMDITDRKTAETQLRESEERFRLLVENSSDTINIIDDQGVIRFQSPSGEWMLGYSPEEFVGRNVLELVHADDAGRVAEAIQRALAAPDSAVAVEFRFHHRDGTWRTFESVGKAMPSKAGERWILVNSRDVTESQKLGEQLRQSQKMEAIGQLSGGVAHDFNNILTVIQGHASLVQQESSLPKNVLESMAEIERASERAAGLTRQLLTFSRRQTMQPRDLDLNEVVSGTTKMLQRILGEDIHMQVHYASHPAFTHADPGMMDQILLNLAVNSRDAMPKGGRLVIETTTVEVDALIATQIPDARPGSFVCLTVSDTGCGIPKNILPHIFEPFFTTKDVGKGTGLGLATVYGIVQQHEGWISIYSEPDHGTTFRIYLPRVAQRLAEQTVKRESLAELRGTETILLVEDETSLRILVRKILSRLGYRIMEAPTGVSALEVWKQNCDDIQLLLTDLVMPDGMTGLELAQRILKERPDLKVIYTSGYSAEIAGKDFPLKQGVNFLAKPFDPHALAQAVRHALDAVPPPSRDDFNGAFRK